MFNLDNITAVFLFFYQEAADSKLNSHFAISWLAIIFLKNVIVGFKC